MKKLKINNFFWNTIDYYFRCFKKQPIPEVNKEEYEEKEADEKYDLLGVQTIIMYNRY
jgi:hypothetical protein